MPRILQNHYVLAVHDAQSTADFFVDKLGFEVRATPPGWVFVERDGVMIMVGECPDDLSPRELGCHNYFGYLVVDDIDGYHAELRDKHVEVLSPLEDQPWGMREFSIRTPEGHRIRIGQSIGQ